MTDPRSDPDTWPIADTPDEPKPRPDDADESDDESDLAGVLHRVFGDERSGPRPGRRIEYRDSGHRGLERPRTR